MLKLSLQERVRKKFRDLVEQAEVSHETLGQYLGLSRSGVSRLLNDDENGFALHHIERLCEYFQVTTAEVFADPGSMIHAITPIESALLTYYRDMTELERRSWLTILDRPRTIAAKSPRLGRAMLTLKEQELVDLFARVKKDGVREGVLRTLKGAAEDARKAAPEPPDTTG